MKATIRRLFRSDPSPETLAAFSVLTLPHLRRYLMDPNASDRSILVGATCLGRPAGLLISLEDPKRQAFRLSSLFVREEFRGQGIGSRLLNELNDIGVSQGIRYLTASRVIGRDQPKEDPFLKKNGWPAFQAELIMGKTLLEQGRNDRYVKPEVHALRNSEIFLWKDLTPAEAEHVQAQQGKPEWHGPVLSPFLFEDLIEPSNSVGLRYKGEVVGWLVTHRTRSDTVRYSCWFTRQDLARAAYGGPLFLRSLQLQLEAGIPYACFEILMDSTRMQRFMSKRIERYVDEYGEGCIAIKALT